MQMGRMSMNRRGLSSILWLGTAALASPAQAQSPHPWAEMARMDLQAIHDVLAANHPGPVDPQNGFYARWLEEGLRRAQERAASAKRFADYERALRLYVNGFRDGHIGVSFTLTSPNYSWPGFIVRRPDPAAPARVVFSSADSGVPQDAEVVRCDGRSLDELASERLVPFFWNADITHERWSSLPRLFLLHPQETELRATSCTFRVAGTERDIPLRWTNIANRDWSEHAAASLGRPGELGLTKRGDLWFVTLPSFQYSGEGAARISALIEEIKAKAPEMRTGTVVFDVRGNGGGNSAWGRRIAAALWSDDWVNRIENSFDWTVDWRASPENLQHLSQIAERSQRDGLADAAASWGRARDAMAAALQRGERLVRVANPATVPTGAPPANPVTGKVFLLTDNACASACLDFADIVRRLPNARHVGLPTSADALYIDNTSAVLPSSVGRLSYSLKVYRNRVRGHNQWYEPHVRWPGGIMTDEALTRWISSLS
jgi:hypothetical protein